MAQQAVRDASVDSKNLSTAYELLHGYGLSRQESRVYTGLLDLGQTTVKNIVTTLDMNRVEAYQILRKLVAIGIVEITLNRPNLYNAVDPFLAVNNLLTESEERLTRMREKAGELVMILQSMASSNPRTEATDHRRVYFGLNGGRQIVAQWARMMAHAKHEILRIWTPKGLSIYDREGFLNTVVCDQLKQGVRFRAIMEVSKHILPEVEVWSNVIELRHRELGPTPLRYMVIDNTEAIIMTSLTSKSSELAGLYTNHRTLIQGLRTQFEELWKTSIPASLMINEIKSKSSRSML